MAPKEADVAKLFAPIFLHDGRLLTMKDSILNSASLAYNHLDDTMMPTDVEKMTKMTETGLTSQAFHNLIKARFFLFASTLYIPLFFISVSHFSFLQPSYYLYTL